MEHAVIDHSFEGAKNRRALLYTAILCGIFLLIAFLYTWPMLIPPIAQVDDLIEVNLGNDAEGLGDVQPLVKGDPAPETQSISSNQSVARANDVPSKSIQADDNNNEEAAALFKKENKNDNSKEENKESIVKNTRAVNPSTVTNPNPSPPKPKVPLYKGGTGNGGNGAAEDNGFRNQGYKPGNGDAGTPTGKPDSYGNSPGGRSGVSVVRGLAGRRPISFPSMQDDFNENAKVYVDIKVDASGRVTDASIARGTTTSNSNFRSIAIQKAKQLKFPASQNDIESGTILFNFVLKS
ncbi:hypothetical protein BH20BAC1_BH20BAC1_17750 [soil metagenome]